MTNLFGLNENFGGIKFSFKDNSIEKSYQKHLKGREIIKSKVFYVFSFIASTFFIMMTLLGNQFHWHITLYTDLIVFIIETILFILSFYIYEKSNLFFIIKYMRYFLQCIATIANIIFPYNDKVNRKIKNIYRVLIFNTLSYFYYIDLDYITFALTPILNTTAIICDQIYQNFEKYYLFTEIGLSITFGIITFFYKKSEHIDKKKSFFESYQKEKDIQYMIELIDNNN